MTPSRRNALASIGVVFSAVVLHVRSLGYGFLNWDDDRFITANPLFASGGWAYVRSALTRVQLEAYHPLHLLSYLPDRWLWPDRAAGFHAINLALFGLDAFLLLRLARQHASLGAAATAVLLFASHPLCVEPVDWISGRKDLLALAFFVGVLLVEDGRVATEVRVSLAGLALFAAALLSKSSTLCLPPLVFCWLVWMRPTTAAIATRRALPYALLGLVPAIAVVKIWRQHEMLGPRPVAAPIDVLATLATYARRTVWPHDLAAIYPVEMPAEVVSAGLAGAFVVAVVLFWRRLPPLARFALVAFPVALLPVANIVPVGLRFADRYAFLALGILVPPAAAGLDALFGAGKSLRAVAFGAVTIAVLSLAAVTFTQSATWKSSRTLWARAAAAHPEVVRARLRYGDTLLEDHDWAGARDEFQAVVRTEPLNSFGYAALFFLYASRAEHEGRIPLGTAHRWILAFRDAQTRSATFDAFMTAVPHTVCPQCADTLLLLRLRRWPKSDELLRKAARSALDEGAPDAALICLDVVIDKGAPEWRALFAEAGRALPHPGSSAVIKP